MNQPVYLQGPSYAREGGIASELIQAVLSEGRTAATSLLMSHVDKGEQGHATLFDHFYSLLANFSIADKDYVGAKTILERGLRLFPKSQKLWSHLLELLWFDGDLSVHLPEIKLILEMLNLLSSQAVESNLKETLVSIGEAKHSDELNHVKTLAKALQDRLQESPASDSATEGWVIISDLQGDPSG